jgi:surfeit locus 1 family protein
VRRPGVLTSLIALIAFCALIALGVWQVQRLKWKTELLRRIDALQATPALPLAAALERAGKGEDVGFTRVQTDCQVPAPTAAAWLYGLSDGAIGWRLIAPCRLEGGTMIAVDRGFLRGADGLQPPSGTPPAGPRRVVGVLREPEPPNFIARQIGQAEDNRLGWRSRDHAVLALQRATGLKAVPVVLVAEREDPAQPALRPEALPRNIPNNHLGYAITWFGLAAALAGVYLAILFAKRS